MRRKREKRKSWLDHKVSLFWTWWTDAIHCGADVHLNAVDGCGGVRFFVGIPWLLNVWLTLDWPWMRRFLPTRMSTTLDPPRPLPEEREIGFAIHHGKVWFRLWNHPDEWNSSDPWWWSFTFDPADFFLGKSKYTEEVKGIHQVYVNMPEGRYAAKAKMSVCTSKRPRWPRAVVTERIEFDYGDKPIPIPGKGTAPWNLDEDGVYKSSVPHPHDDLHGAVYKQSVSAMKTRWKYGGFSWVPEGYQEVQIKPEVQP